ncbi:MAG: hypothetical protein D3916_17420 [Candidatus Electrothrix sp. MAN1_4]|nr:hypothetical protein [Candidatus Electrothrix sp. MAN1_4]
MFVRYNHYRIYKEKSYNGSIWIHLFIMGLGIKNTLSQMSEWGDIPFLEYLWSKAYLYFTYYHEYVDFAEQKRKKNFDLKKNYFCNIAWYLQLWASDNLKSRETSWPYDLPTPSVYDNRSNKYIRLNKNGHRKLERYILNANEAFLYAIAWIFHHELAHYSLGHSRDQKQEFSGTNTGTKDEKDADIQAVKMILEKKNDETQITNCTLGIVIALLSLQASAAETSLIPKKIKAHPEAYNRLYNCLDNIPELDDNHKIYAFGICIMQHQLAQHFSVDFGQQKNTLKETFHEGLYKFNSYFRGIV